MDKPEDTIVQEGFKDYFSDHAPTYADYRPQYTTELATALDMMA